MRLFELINFEPKDSPRDAKHRSNRVITPSSKIIGKGHFATAHEYNSEKRQGEIRKQGRAGKPGSRKAGPKPTGKITGDAYLSYLKMIYDFEQKGGQNPFFPVITNLSIFRAMDGTLDYKADLQKLVELTSDKISDNEPVMKHVFKSLFNDDQRPSEYDRGELDALSIMRELRIGIMDGIPNGNFDLIRNPDLKSALSMTRDLAKKHRFTWDIHAGNLMWRITGNIPQLVLTDILS